MIYKDLDLLKNEINKLKSEGKKIVWTNGCFDIIHPGHIETFKECKKLGDIVIVGLNGNESPYWSEKPGRPINDEKFRSLMLDAISYIDYIYIYNDETPLDALKELLPDVLVKGGDYDLEKIVGYKEITDNGGKVLTVPVLGDYSTTNIVKKILNTYK
ncbi:MAG: adenylyltransferase/cytidyltransferase family protein [Candidatus Gracilibacteria bacterium]|nr:adenylyltransferase/cytidyltransferase family protein [Candidatus Gracilibacteria bacterium]